MVEYIIVIGHGENKKLSILFNFVRIDSQNNKKNKIKEWENLVKLNFN